jgi:hypothetical protein
MSGQREHRESQPGRPALGPLVEHGGDVVGQRDPGGGHQLPGLLLGETQLGDADLGQLAGQSQSVQAQRRVVTGGHDRVCVRGEVRQQ